MNFIFRIEGSQLERNKPLGTTTPLLKNYNPESDNFLGAWNVIVHSFIQDHYVEGKE